MNSINSSGREMRNGTQRFGAILGLTIHIRNSQDNRIQAVLRAKELEVLLYGELMNTVGTDWISRVALGNWIPSRYAIDGSAGRNKHHTSDTRSCGCFQDSHCCHYVGFQIKHDVGVRG